MLNVAILCSHSAPGIEDLLNDPARGVDYEIRCIVTNNRELRGRDALVEAGITCIARPQPPEDPVEREKYDAATARYLKIFDVDRVIDLRDSDQGRRRLLQAIA